MVYICILNYNNPSDTIACLDSLLALVGPDFKILLVDNDSSDTSHTILRKYALKHQEKIIFFPLEKNLGYAGGNNVAIRYALQQSDMEYCWILNNDTIVEPDAMLWLYRYMETHHNVGLCGSKLMYEWDRNKLQGYGGVYSPLFGLSSTCRDLGKLDTINFVIGASVFARRLFLEDVGLMCEDYFLYYEEIDWSIRAHRKFSIACEPRSIVYHKEGASIGAGAKKLGEKTELCDYFYMRNRLLITRKFFPWCIPTVYLSSIGMMLNRFKRHQYSRIWMLIKLLLGIRDEKYESKLIH